MKSIGKDWRMDNWFAGKRKTLDFGVYSTVSFVDTRKKGEETRKQLIEDIVPSFVKAINNQIEC